MVKDDGGAVRRAFGARVRELRTERGISQEALALLAGISPRYLSDVELGKRNIALENIAALAIALGVELGDFFAGMVVEQRSHLDQ